MNYSATGTDNDSTRAKIQYFGPNSQGFFDFTRFPHAQEHQNLDNMNASAIIPGTGPGSGQPVIPQDLNKGQDYAIRVNQYEAQYKFNVLGKPGKDTRFIRFNEPISITDNFHASIIHLYTKLYHQTIPSPGSVAKLAFGGKIRKSALGKSTTCES